MVYETIIHIITEGTDALDAGEKAGELIDISKMESGMSVNCEPTKERY